METSEQKRRAPALVASSASLYHNKSDGKVNFIYPPHQDKGFLLPEESSTHLPGGCNTSVKRHEDAGGTQVQTLWK